MPTPVINSVVGSPIQQRNITLNVSDSTANNSSQVSFHVGDRVRAGFSGLAEDLFPNSGGSAGDYRHTNEDSGMNSGACLISNVVDGVLPSQCWEQLPDMTEIYFSVLFKHKDQVLIAGGSDPQYKPPRITCALDYHEGAPSFASGPQFFRGADGITPDSISDIVVMNGNRQTCNTRCDTWLVNQDEWQRFHFYWKASDVDTANGSAWFLMSNLDRQEDYLGGKEFNTNKMLNNPDWFEADVPDSKLSFMPSYNHLTVSSTDVHTPSIKRAYAAFYARTNTSVKWLQDGWYINDSMERVELCNNADYRLATKRVVQKQINRTLTSIEFEAYLGNLTDADQIFAVSFNTDGDHSIGIDIGNIVRRHIASGTKTDTVPFAQWST